MLQKVLQSPFLPIGIVALLLVTVVLLLRSRVSNVIKYDVNTTVTSLFVLGILGLINALCVTTPELQLGSVRVPLQGEVDVTKNRRHSISEQTIRIMKTMPEKVQAIAFYRGGQPETQAVKDLLDQYVKASQGRFAYRLVDPVLEPVEARKYRDLLIRDMGGQAAAVSELIVLEVGDRRVSVQLPITNQVGEEEQKLTNAMLDVLNPDKKTVYFISGHGERLPDDTGNDGVGTAKDAMEKLVYKVKTFQLFQGQDLPSDGAAFILCGPQKDLTSVEADMLSRYLEKGGRLLVMLDAGQNFPNLAALCQKYGIMLSDDLVWDDKMAYQTPVNPAIVKYKAVPITSGFTFPVFLIIARSVSAGTVPPNVKVEAFASTSPNSYALQNVSKKTSAKDLQPSEGDRKGPIDVAAQAVITPRTTEGVPSDKPGKEGRLVVIGNSMFVTREAFHIAGNGDLFLRCVNWLSQTGNEIKIEITGQRIKNENPLSLPEEKKSLMGKIAIFGVPLGLIILGVLTFMAADALRARRRVHPKSEE